MSKLSRMKQAMLRSNPRLLMTLVTVFEGLAMLLVAFRAETVSVQSLILAAALPLGTWLFTSLLARRWQIDRTMLILVLFLCAIGIITLSAIARAEITPRTHAIYCAAGLAAMVAGLIFIRSFHAWDRALIPLMILCAAALASPLVFGRWVQGARNWIYFGESLSIQPSEFMKPVLVVILANGMKNRPGLVKCLPTIIFSALCCAILLVERDLGAVLLYFLTTVLMFYAATGNTLVTLSGLAMGAGAAVLAYRTIPLVQSRVAIWIDPWSDIEGKGWQLAQSLMAIGSGGLFGMGLGLGSPRKIPLYHSDFIFASITEEFGLIFAVCLLAVYVLIIMRGLIAAMNARTSFLSLTAFGLMVLLALQTMLIVSGNTKLLPLTGVTLPLICYGGSSLVSTLGSIGLVLGISSLNAEEEEADFDHLAMLEEANDE